MYWLIGSLIIIVMIGVLAVADSMPLPVSLLLADLTATATLPLLLTILTIVLLVVSQRRIPYPRSFNEKNLLLKTLLLKILRKPQRIACRYFLSVSAIYY